MNQHEFNDTLASAVHYLLRTAAHGGIDKDLMDSYATKLWKANQSFNGSDVAKDAAAGKPADASKDGPRNDPKHADQPASFAGPDLKGASVTKPSDNSDHAKPAAPKSHDNPSDARPTTKTAPGAEAGHTMPSKTAVKEGIKNDAGTHAK